MAGDGGSAGRGGRRRGRRTIWKLLRSSPAAEQEGPGSRARGLRSVCYGLGSFCSCGKARLQLAFLLLLLEELK
ncbi:hypothetical protein E2320_012385, partial [Naja naja]